MVPVPKRLKPETTNPHKGTRNSFRAVSSGSCVSWFLPRKRNPEPITLQARAVLRVFSCDLVVPVPKRLKPETTNSHKGTRNSFRVVSCDLVVPVPKRPKPETTNSHKATRNSFRVVSCDLVVPVPKRLKPETTNSHKGTRKSQPPITRNTRTAIRFPLRPNFIFITRNNQS